jgi:hypothetical protein
MMDAGFDSLWRCDASPLEDADGSLSFAEWELCIGQPTVR